jgi:hypothetical protein
MTEPKSRRSPAWASFWAYGAQKRPGPIDDSPAVTAATAATPCRRTSDCTAGNRRFFGSCFADPHDVGRTSIGVPLRMVGHVVGPRQWCLVIPPLRPKNAGASPMAHGPAGTCLTSVSADEICAPHDAVRSLPVATPPLSRAAQRRARVTGAPYREAAGEDQAASPSPSFYSSRLLPEALNLRVRRP